MERQAPLIYLDTHVVIWMYAGLDDRLSEKARQAIEQNDLFVSPMAQLEIEYLFETGKITTPSKDIIDDLENRLGLRLCDLSFERFMSQALKNPWTRDPFDRLIVAQAAARNSKLLTKDQSILKNYSKALW